MPGHAAASGSALGGFIEGAFGGFERITEFQRRRRLEQQVAEQLRSQTARQGREDVRQVGLDEEAAETLRRSRELEDLNLFLDRGIVRTPSDAGTAQEVPESVSNLRGATGARILEGVGAQGPPGPGVSPTPTQVPGADPRAVGANLLGPDEPQAVDPTDAMLERLGFRQAGPSRTDLINEALATDDPQAFLRENPRALSALKGVGLLDTVIDKFTPFTVTFQGVSQDVATEAEAISLRGTLALAASKDPVTAADLRAEFARDPVVKDSAQIAQSFSRMAAVAGETSSGPNDLAVIFSFMKLLDPGSVVREGEFANAQNSQGVPERVRAMYNRALRGERLTDETRLEFVKSAESLIRGQRQVLDRVLERYRGLAERSRIPVGDIIFDPFGPVDEDADEFSEDNPFGPGR